MHIDNPITVRRRRGRKYGDLDAASSGDHLSGKMYFSRENRNRQGATESDEVGSYIDTRSKLLHRSPSIFARGLLRRFTTQPLFHVALLTHIRLLFSINIYLFGANEQDC